MNLRIEPLPDKALADAFFSRDSKRFRESLEPITFDSRSEVACAILMERFIPGYVCEPGRTFQIPIHRKRIDFRIESGNHFIWFEYHPITKHEFDNSSAFHKLSETLRHLPRETKGSVWDALKMEFSTKYYRRRRLLLDLTGHENDKLIVAESPTQFYREIIRKFGEGFPHEPEFLRLWSKIISASF